MSIQDGVFEDGIGEMAILAIRSWMDQDVFFRQGSIPVSGFYSKTLIIYFMYTLDYLRAPVGFVGDIRYPLLKLLSRKFRLSNYWNVPS